VSGCCPVCKRAVEDDAPHAPFCCDRCRLVDLGRWLDGEYRVPDDPGLEDRPDDDDAGAN
jgi:uncharacterized protein